jgi:hypothetical protein
MRDRLKRALLSHPLVPVAVALFLLATAALLVPERIPLGDGSNGNRIVVPDPPLLAGFLLIVLVLSLLILYIVARAKRPKRAAKELAPRRKKGWMQVVGIILLPVFFVLSAPLRNALERLLERAPGSPPSSKGGPGTPTPPAIQEHSAILGLMLTLLLLILVLGTFYLIYTLSRSDNMRGKARGGPVTFQGAIALGMEDLRSIRSPRAAVIACYSRLQALADRIGAHRETDTPLELMDRLAGDSNVSRKSLGTLTSLFERAKFSRHEIDESMRVEALDALTDVNEQLDEP